MLPRAARSFQQLKGVTWSCQPIFPLFPMFGVSRWGNFVLNHSTLSADGNHRSAAATWRKLALTGGALGQPTSLPLALSFVSESAGLKIQFVPLVDIGNECQNQNNLFFGDAFFCSCLYPSPDEEAAQEPCCDHGHNVRKHVQWRTPKTKSSNRTARN